jgi:hypothetical protein
MSHGLGKERSQRDYQGREDSINKSMIIAAIILAIFILAIILVKNKKKIKHSTTRIFVNKKARRIIKPKPREPEDSGDALILSDSDRMHVVGKKGNPLN